MISLMVEDDFQEVLDLGLTLHSNFANIYDFESLNEGVNKTYVIKDNDILVGFIHIQDLFDEIDIIDIVINSNYQRKGYGSKLLDYVFNAYNDKKFILDVSSENISALSFYEHFGFKEINRRKGYYNGVDAIIMERK